MRIPMLYQRGGTWWVRLVYEGRDRRCSTGERHYDTALAYVTAFVQSATRHQHRPILDAILAGRLPLVDFGRAYYGDAMGELLRRAMARNLEPEVARWLRHLQRTAAVAEETRREYDAKVRSLMPPGAPFYSDELTTRRVREWLAELVHPRTGAPVSNTTRRHYYDALRAFVRWLREDGVLMGDPLADCPVPPLNRARDRILEYPELRAALDACADALPRAALFTIAGSGMEQQAIQRAHGRDVIRGQAVLGHPTNGLYAHGSKNGYRSRVAFVRAWAWREAAPVIDAALPAGRCFPCGEDWIRRTWREAQLAAKVADAGSLLTVHDLRHCWCVMVALGTDGEPRLDLQFQADNLGHGDTTMVSRVYGKYRLRDRLRAIEALELQRAATSPTLALVRTG